MRQLVLAILLGGIVAERAARADSSSFPYTAFVNSTSVYVRSGPGENYYPTGKLSMGAAVEVYRHDPGGWYAIRPTSDSFSWVRADMIEVRGENRAVVRRERVAARVGSTLSDARDVIQVYLDEGEEVVVLEARRFGKGPGAQTWYKIAPPPGEFRWIFGQFVDAQPAPHEPRAHDARRERVLRSPERQEFAARDSTETARAESMDDEAHGDDAAHGSFDPVDEAGWSRAARERRDDDSREAQTVAGFERPRRRSRRPAPRDETRETEEGGDSADDEYASREPREENEESRGAYITEEEHAQRRGDPFDDGWGEPLDGDIEAEGHARGEEDELDARSGRRGAAAGERRRETTYEAHRDDPRRNRRRPAGDDRGDSALDERGDPIDPFGGPLDEEAEEPASPGRARGRRDQDEPFAEESTRDRQRLEPTAGFSPLSGAPSEAEFATALDELDLALSAEVSSEGTWNLERLRARAEELLAHASTAIERGRVRLMSKKIARFDELQSRTLSGNAAVAASETRDGATAEGIVRGGRYDGMGRLTRVVASRPGDPSFALVDRQGVVRYYVTAAPGLNLRHYVGREVGLSGSIGYWPELNTQHVTAQRVTLLDDPAARLR